MNKAERRCLEKQGKKNQKRLPDFADALPEAYEEFSKNIENRPAVQEHLFYEDWVNYYIFCGISVSTAGRQGLHECKEMFRLTRIEIVVPRFQSICFKDV